MLDPLVVVITRQEVDSLDITRPLNMLQCRYLFFKLAPDCDFELFVFGTSALLNTSMVEEFFGSIVRCYG
jgi:hypothetical protein